MGGCKIFFSQVDQGLDVISFYVTRIQFYGVFQKAEGLFVLVVDGIDTGQFNLGAHLLGVATSFDGCFIIARIQLYRLAAEINNLLVECAGLIFVIFAHLQIGQVPLGKKVVAIYSQCFFKILAGVGVSLLAAHLFFLLFSLFRNGGVALFGQIRVDGSLSFSLLLEIFGCGKSVTLLHPVVAKVSQGLNVAGIGADLFLIAVYFALQFVLGLPSSLSLLLLFVATYSKAHNSRGHAKGNDQEPDSYLNEKVSAFLLWSNFTYFCVHLTYSFALHAIGRFTFVGSHNLRS